MASPGSEQNEATGAARFCEGSRLYRGQNISEVSFPRGLVTHGQRWGVIQLFGLLSPLAVCLFALRPASSPLLASADTGR